MSQGKPIAVIHNFLILSVDESRMSDRILEILQDKITTYIEDIFELNGAFVVSSQNHETMIYSKSMNEFSEIKMIADLVSSFDQTRFFKHFSGPNFKEVDILRFDHHHIYYARFTDSLSIFLVFTDSTKSLEAQVIGILESLQKKMDEIKKPITTLPSPKIPNKIEEKTTNTINTSTGVPQPPIEQDSKLNTEQNEKKSETDVGVPLPKY